MLFGCQRHILGGGREHPSHLHPLLHVLDQTPRKRPLLSSLCHSCFALRTHVFPCSPCASSPPLPQHWEGNEGWPSSPTLPPGLFQWCPESSGVTCVSPSLPPGTSGPPGSILVGGLVLRQSALQLVANLLFRLLLGTCPRSGDIHHPGPLLSLGPCSAPPLPSAPHP